MEHTKGKWKKGRTLYSYIEIDHPECTSLIIAKVIFNTDKNQYGGISQEEAEANTRLILAAPELLAACRRIKKRCDTGGLIDKDTTGLYNCVKFAILAAEA